MSNVPFTHRRLQAETALLTRRTVVRRFRENDGEAFFDLVQNNHSRLNDFFPDLPQAIHNPLEAEWMVRRWLADWLQLHAFRFAIWEKELASIIGFIQLTQMDWRIPKAEVSFFIDRDFENQGLMTEALEHLVRFAFREIDLEKLIVRPPMDNYPSQRLVRKVGFQREGDLRADMRLPNGELVDVMLFGLSKSTYEKV